MTKHCPACHEPLVTTETEAGEQVCLACGVVLSSTAYITSYSTTNHVTHPSLSLCRSKVSLSYLFLLFSFTDIH
jgi:transcription initiation factor TFIIIB Brf1 subunit/transcription initiation factor TFIIB